MNQKDLIIGETYYCEWNSDCKALIKFYEPCSNPTSGMPSRRAILLIHLRDFKEGDINNGNNMTYVAATDKQRDWMNQCIAAGGFVEYTSNHNPLIFN